MNINRLLFVQLQTLPLRVHHKWKEMIDMYTKQPMKNHRGLTPDEESH